MQQWGKFWLTQVHNTSRSLSAEAELVVTTGTDIKNQHICSHTLITEISRWNQVTENDSRNFWIWSSSPHIVTVFCYTAQLFHVRIPTTFQNSLTDKLNLNITSKSDRTYTGNERYVMPVHKRKLQLLLSLSCKVTQAGRTSCTYSVYKMYDQNRFHLRVFGIILHKFCDYNGNSQLVSSD